MTPEPEPDPDPEPTPDPEPEPEIDFEDTEYYVSEVIPSETEGESYWQLVTDGVKGIESGKKYLISARDKSGNSVKYYFLDKDKNTPPIITVNDNKVTAVDEKYQFVFTKTDDMWIITDSDGDYVFPNAT